MKKTVSLLLLFTFSLTLLTQDLLFARGAREAKYSLAVLPFTVKGRIANDPSVRLAKRLQRELDNLRLFDLEDLDLVENILRDNGIIPSNCASVECGKRAGELIGVRLVASGEIRKAGSAYFIDVKIIHVSSGQVVQNVRDEIEGKLDDVLNAMPTIAARLVGKKPLAAQTVRQARQQMQPVESKNPDALIIDTQPESEPINIGEQPAEINLQAKTGKKGSHIAKWALLGVLLAGGVGAGVLLATKGNGNGGENGTGTITKLPGHPTFP